MDQIRINWPAKILGWGLVPHPCPILFILDYWKTFDYLETWLKLVMLENLQAFFFRNLTFELIWSRTSGLISPVSPEKRAKKPWVLELITSISCKVTVCTTSLRFCNSPSGHCTNRVVAPVIESIKWKWIKSKKYQKISGLRFKKNQLWFFQY